MVCINCGSEIFEGDRFCSRCGTRVTEPTSQTAAEIPAETENSGTEAVKPEETEVVNAENAKPEAEKPDAAKAEPERVLPPCIPEENPSKSKGRWRSRNAASEPDKPKKWLPKVILGIFGVALVILAVNSAKLINSYHRNFSTPEEYYRWVEHKSVRRSAGIFAEYYVNYYVEALHRYDRHISGEIRVELGDAGKDMMELAGIDLAWFEKGAITFESTGKDKVMQSIVGLEVGGEKLFTMDAIMDLTDEAAYMGFPGLTKTYLALDTGEKKFVDGFSYASGMEPEEYLESMELLEVLYKECPDKRQMENLANRYLELLLNSIDNVKMRTGKTARAGNITQTCTTLEIYLDKNDIQNMLTEFLEELQEDREIEELLIQIFNMAEELELEIGNYRDADEFYEAFQGNIDEILDDIDYYITYHDELDMTVYVDNKGQIIGRTLEFPNSWDEVAISYLNPHKGSKFGFKGSIVSDGEEVSVTGSGRDFGNKISGSFTVKYEGSGIVNVEVKDFDKKALKKGYVNGNFTVTAASGVSRALDMSAASSYLSDMKLVINVSMNRSSEELNMELKEGRELWGSLTITSRRGKGKKISVPSTRSAIFVDSDRDFEDWWDTIKWDDLLKKMGKAGLPSGAIDAVEEFSEMDTDEVMDELTDAMWSLIYDLVQ